jgi:hypothetical protein
MSDRLLIKQFVMISKILFASLLFPIFTHAQNMNASINASNKNSVSNLSDITSQGNISKSINGTFNTSLSNKAMMSNSS